MTLEREKAIKMLKAKLECMTRDVSGCDDDCNRKLCGECHLNYEQGNMGEQKEYLRMSIEALEQEPCEDCISRQLMYELGATCIAARNKSGELVALCGIDFLPSVTPQSKIGHWLRMSDLSEHEDDRYKCSRCGNVVHHTNKMNLYTFNSWCGRCGSDNGRKRG